MPEQHPFEEMYVHVAKTLIEKFDDVHSWEQGRLLYNVHMRSVAEAAVDAVLSYQAAKFLDASTDEGETPQPSAHAKHCDGPQCGLIGLPGDDSPWCECDCPLCDESVPVETAE